MPLIGGELRDFITNQLLALVAGDRLNNLTSGLADAAQDIISSNEYNFIIILYIYLYFVLTYKF